METKVHKAQGGYSQRLARTNNPTKKFPLSFLLLSLCSVNVYLVVVKQHTKRERKNESKDRKTSGGNRTFFFLTSLSLLLLLLCGFRSRVDGHGVCHTGGKRDQNWCRTPMLSCICRPVHCWPVSSRTLSYITPHTYNGRNKTTTGHERKKGLFAECIVLI